MISAWDSFLFDNNNLQKPQRASNGRPFVLAFVTLLALYLWCFPPASPRTFPRLKIAHPSPKCLPLLYAVAYRLRGGRLRVGRPWRSRRLSSSSGHRAGFRLAPAAPRVAAPCKKRPAPPRIKSAPPPAKDAPRAPRAPRAALLAPALCTLHSALCILHSAFCILHSALPPAHAQIAIYGGMAD